MAVAHDESACPVPHMSVKVGEPRTVAMVGAGRVSELISEVTVSLEAPISANGVRGYALRAPTSFSCTVPAAAQAPAEENTGVQQAQQKLQATNAENANLRRQLEMLQRAANVENANLRRGLEDLQRPAPALHPRGAADHSVITLKQRPFVRTVASDSRLDAVPQDTANIEKEHSCAPVEERCGLAPGMAAWAPKAAASQKALEQILQEIAGDTRSQGAQAPRAGVDPQLSADLDRRFAVFCEAGSSSGGLSHVVGSLQELQESHGQMALENAALWERLRTENIGLYQQIAGRSGKQEPLHSESESTILPNSSSPSLESSFQRPDTFSPLRRCYARNVPKLIDMLATQVERSARNDERLARFATRLCTSPGRSRGASRAQAAETLATVANAPQIRSLSRSSSTPSLRGCRFAPSVPPVVAPVGPLQLSNARVMAAKSSQQILVARPMQRNSSSVFL